MINPIEIIQSIPDRMYKIMTDDQIKIYVLEEIQRRQADPLTDEEVTTEEDEVTEVTEDDEEEDEVTEVTEDDEEEEEEETEETDEGDEGDEGDGAGDSE